MKRAAVRDSDQSVNGLWCGVLRDGANHGPVSNVLIRSRPEKLSDIRIGLDVV